MIAADWFEHIYNMDWYEVRNSFPLVATGSSRWVYDMGGGYVIKLATNKDGYDQCSRENRVYTHADNYYRRYLCPLFWYAPGMVVMQKAVPMVPLHMVLGDPQVDLYSLGFGSKGYSDLKYLSKRFGLLYEDLLSVTSWGYLGNRPVLIDYGCRK